MKVNVQKYTRETILSWLIDCDVIQKNAKVVVIEEETRKKIEKIKKEGIYETSISMLDKKTRKHYKYILIAEKCSLLLSSM
ncbi:hypothetical protein H5410_056740, partial [Solanum commersonii]